MIEGYEKTASLICAAAVSEKLVKVILSKPSDKSVRKASLTPKIIASSQKLQYERLMSDNKALHKNIPADEKAEIAEIVSSFFQINVITSAGECQISRSKKGRILDNGTDKLLRALSLSEEKLTYGDNNRKKDYILSGNEDFLVKLEVSDKNGRVYDKKQSKFRQINRFLEYVRDAVPFLKSEGELSVLDLCCGKSYLSFALYHYLTRILGRDVRMTGIDLKEDVICECAQIARDLGYDRLEFICGDIRDCKEKSCDMVVSLHACDIATDIVLTTAVACRADVILSTPCCHHELANIIDCPELEFIYRYPILGGKLCDAATDALRLLYLEKEGYEASAFELIDPQETPKNVLVRGIRRKNFKKDSNEARALSMQFESATSFLTNGKGYKHLINESETENG